MTATHAAWLAKWTSQVCVTRDTTFVWQKALVKKPFCEDMSVQLETCLILSFLFSIPKIRIRIHGNNLKAHAVRLLFFFKLLHQGGRWVLIIVRSKIKSFDWILIGKKKKKKKKKKNKKNRRFKFWANNINGSITETTLQYLT